MWTATDGTNTYQLANVSINKQLDGLGYVDIVTNTDIAVGTVLTIFYGSLQVFKGVVTKKNVQSDGRYEIHLVEEAIELQNQIVQDASGNYVFTVTNEVLDNLVDLILTGSGWTRISSNTTITIPAISFAYSTKLDALSRVVKDYAGLHLWFGDGQLSRSDTIGTGDGATTSFSATLTYLPVVAGTLNISYTIGGVAYTATDDGAGNITGTDVTGTIDYTTGAVSLTFTTAPDAGTAISATYQQYIAKGVYFGSTRNAIGAVQIVQKNYEESTENRNVNIVIVFGNDDSIYGVYNDGLGNKTVVYKYGEAKSADECTVVATQIYNILKNEYKRIEIITPIQAIEPGDTVTVDTVDYTVYQIEIDNYYMTLHLNAKKITLFDVFGDKLMKYSGSVKVGKLTTNSVPGQWMLFGSQVGCKYTFDIDDVSLVKNYTITVTLDQYRKALSLASATTGITNSSSVTSITESSATTGITNASSTTALTNNTSTSNITIEWATGGDYECSATTLVYAATTVTAGTTNYYTTSWTSTWTHNSFMMVVYASLHTTTGYPEWCYITISEWAATETSYTVTVHVNPASSVVTIPSVVTNTGTYCEWQIAIEAPYNDIVIDWLCVAYIGFGRVGVYPVDQGHTHTVTDPGHTHSVTDPGHSHSLTDPGHTHAITDPGHSHAETDDVSLLASYPSNVQVYVNGTLIDTIAGGAADTKTYDITANLINGTNTIEFKPDTTNGSTPGSIYIAPKLTVYTF